MATQNTAYTKIGEFTVVPIADLSLLAASVNQNGDGRKGVGRANGPSSLGKHAGMLVLADTGSTTYRLVMALGRLPADKWQDLGVVATQYTPI